MAHDLIKRIEGKLRRASGSRARPLARAAEILLALALVAGLTGCQETPQNFAELDAAKSGGITAAGTGAGAAATKVEATVLHEGDSVRVAFPGAPTLNPGVQQIRPDGKITLPLIGEYKAAGQTAADMQKELIKLYEPQLQTKEVTVTLEASAFTVYVTGSVLRAGKVTSDRPITVLQAIAEAGGFDPSRANMKKVAVIRHLKDRTERFTVNLKRVMDGLESESVTLKPMDIIFVPERFNWF